MRIIAFTIISIVLTSFINIDSDPCKLRGVNIQEIEQDECFITLTKVMVENKFEFNPNLKDEIVFFSQNLESNLYKIIVVRFNDTEVVVKKMESNKAKKIKSHCFKKDKILKLEKGISKNFIVRNCFVEDGVNEVLRIKKGDVLSTCLISYGLRLSTSKNICKGETSDIVELIKILEKI